MCCQGGELGVGRRLIAILVVTVGTAVAAAAMVGKAKQNRMVHDMQNLL
ncbi:hypothetical protein [Archaeoglobus neptunius]|nr:hypothetical protein [Archaeoglobus neptunius]